MNLYDETERELRSNGKSFADINYIGTEITGIPIDTFIEIAKKTEYNGSYGAQEVAQNIMILGNGFWMTRGEYDGSEWWEYHEMPQINSVNYIEIYCLSVNQSNEDISCGWESLEAMNGLEE